MWLSSELNSPIPVHFGSLIPRISAFTLVISCLTSSNLPWIHGPNIPGSYVILLFIAPDFTSITSHIHNWVVFLFWLHLFILSGISSPLIFSSILGTYPPGEFLFQCPIFLPFHTVHGVLKARILKWFAVPFCGGQCFVRLTMRHNSVMLKKKRNRVTILRRENTRKNWYVETRHVYCKRSPEWGVFASRVWAHTMQSFEYLGGTFVSLSKWNSWIRFGDRERLWLEIF